LPLFATTCPKLLAICLLARGELTRYHEDPRQSCLAPAVQSARHERGSYHGKYRLHLQISDVLSYRSHDCFRVARIEPRTMARYIAFSEHEQNLAALRSWGRYCQVASAAERASRQGRAACECRGENHVRSGKLGLTGSGSIVSLRQTELKAMRSKRPLSLFRGAIGARRPRRSTESCCCAR
jgi:hypothetical protein